MLVDPFFLFPIRWVGELGAGYVIGLVVAIYGDLFVFFLVGERGKGGKHGKRGRGSAFEGDE